MKSPPNQLNEMFMSEALALAALGRGHVEPNPMVGCIIHKSGQVIGRGYHHAFGMPHAEPDALSNCQQSPRGATAVVTLEPCCHSNKKTPPCVPALIAAGIARVIVGHVDPNPAVSGRGIAQLQSAGVEVVQGVMENECRQLNAPFFSLMRHGRPYVTLKWAQTADRYIGGPSRSPCSISSAPANSLVHQLRTRCDAIMVGVDTVLSDDPLLTVRNMPMVRTPIRCILDTHLRTPLHARLVSTARQIPTHVFHGPVASAAGDALRAAGVVLHEVPLAGGHVDFAATLAVLGNMRLTHLLVEPGERLARSIVSSGLFDRLWVIQSDQPATQTGIDCPRAPRLAIPPVGQRVLGPDTISEYLNSASPVFFAARPSPDLLHATPPSGPHDSPAL